MPGLMDMFQPQSMTDPNQRMGFGDALAQRSGSLIGLGMGMLQPTQPGESAMANALKGYMVGNQGDQTQANRQAQLAHQRNQEAFQRSQAARAQSNADRAFGFQSSQAAQAQANADRAFGLQQDQFTRNDPANAPTDFTRAARDLGLTPGTPEHTEFAKNFYAPKSEGNLAVQAQQRANIAKSQGLDVNDPKVKTWIVGGGTLNEENKPLPAEMSSRIALGGKFLDEAPAIRKQIDSGMATDTAEGKLKTYFNMGDQGEVARKVKSGTDALLRSLTGAGMPDAEARKYVARYEIQPTDNKTTALSKFDQLQDELSRAEQEAYRGRGGIPRDVQERRRTAHEASSKDAVAGPAKAAPSGGRRIDRTRAKAAGYSDAEIDAFERGP